MALDDLLMRIGELGRYQWYIFILACLGSVICPVTLFSQVFFTISLPHWCDVYSWDYDDCEMYGLNYPQCEEAQRNLSIPWSDDHGYAECEMYNVTGLEFDSDLIGDNLDIVKCQNGWKYDERETGRTLTSKYDLVCDREVLIHIGQSLYFIGCLIGCPIFGTLSDRIGRIYAWGLCISQSLLFAILMLFSNNFWTYTTLRTLMAMSNYALWIIPFVYISEIVGHSKRMFVGLVVELFWAGGYVLITALSWIIGDWMYLHFVVIGIHIITYPVLFLIPESPRWLLAKGRIEKAEIILKMIARRNGKAMPPDYRKDLVDETKLAESQEKSSSDVKPIDIFRNRTMLLWTSILVVVWFGHGMTYFGLTFMSGDLGFPFYPSFFIQAAVEIPAYIFCILLLSCVGRRKPTAFFMVMAGVACLVSLITPPGVWRALMIFVAKFDISVSFVVLFVYTAEIFPTAVRGFGLSFLAIISMVGETLSPLILILSHWWHPFPMVFCGILTFCGGVLVLLLPETRGTMLPETIEEAVALGSSKQRIPSEDYEEVTV